MSIFVDPWPSFAERRPDGRVGLRARFVASRPCSAWSWQRHCWRCSGFLGQPTEGLWAHLASTVLAEYVRNSVRCSAWA